MARRPASWTATGTIESSGAPLFGRAIARVTSTAGWSLHWMKALGSFARFSAFLSLAIASGCAASGKASSRGAARASRQKNCSLPLWDPIFQPLPRGLAAARSRMTKSLRPVSRILVPDARAFDGTTTVASQKFSRSWRSAFRSRLKR